MSHQRISILGFTLFLIVASFARAEESERDPNLPPPGYVYVEQTDLVAPKPPEHDFKLKPYVDRRGKWGVLVGFAYNSYTPSNFVSNFSDGANFGSSISTALFEGQFAIKRNLSFGSLGLEFGAGNYSNVASDGSKLQLMQLRVGALYILDTLFASKGPYVAPYVSIGAYTMNSSQSLNGTSYNATTSLAPYVTVGAQFTLDWLDRISSRLAYESGGVQSTFVFLEVRSYFASSNSSDPDFSSGISPGGGLRIEF